MKTKKIFEIDEDEFNTILGALRFYQKAGMSEPFKRPDWLHDIVCPDPGANTSLSDEEIDRLCENLNCLDFSYKHFKKNEKLLKNTAVCIECMADMVPHSSDKCPRCR